LRIVYPEAEQKETRIEPVIHFRPIMEHIIKDAEKRYGNIVEPGEMKKPGVSVSEVKDPRKVN